MKAYLSSKEGRFYPCFNGIRVLTEGKTDVILNGKMFLSLF